MRQFKNVYYMFDFNSVSKYRVLEIEIIWHNIASVVEKLIFIWYSPRQNIPHVIKQ